MLVVAPLLSTCIALAEPGGGQGMGGGGGGFRTACATDIQQFCSNITPGGGAIVKCLKENQVSKTCSEFVSKLGAGPGQFGMRGLSGSAGRGGSNKGARGLSGGSIGGQQQGANRSSRSNSGATGDGKNDFGACNADAEKLGCYDTASKNAASSSWKLAFVACLDSNEPSLSAACVASLKRRSDANAEWRSACKAEMGSLCSSVVPKPGSEPMVDCLKANQSQLSSGCSSAISKQQAMKPTQ